MELKHANFLGAKLWRANLQGARFFDANFPGTDLHYADLRKTYLHRIKNWDKIADIRLANISGVQNPPKGFIEWALAHGAVSIEADEEWEKLIEADKEAKRKAE